MNKRQMNEINTRGKYISYGEGERDRDLRNSHQVTSIRIVHNVFRYSLRGKKSAN